MEVELSERKKLTEKKNLEMGLDLGERFEHQ
jgi:hypothetical protein